MIIDLLLWAMKLLWSGFTQEQHNKVNMKDLLKKSESFENSEASEHSERTEISEQTFPGDNTSISDMESELQTDQSVQGSPFDHSAGITNKDFSSFI